MSLFGNARDYATSRQTLIHAIRALGSLPPGSFVLIGAHAVYLRAPNGIVSIPPFTLDGDLAADPRKIGAARTIPDHLERAGFVFRNEYGGFYTRGDALPEDREASKLDVLVPQTVAHLWELDGYGKRDSLATHTQQGLELCLLDHSPMRLGLVETNDDVESVTVEVASILALLIAKGWKIGERFEQGLDAFREVRKDVADVYRLLRAGSPADMESTIRRLPHDEGVREIARTGARHLRELCGVRGPGVTLLSEVLGSSEEATIVLASIEVLAEDFAALVDASLPM